MARLRYTQIAGANEGGATFISTGREAFVDVDGTAYRLPDDQTCRSRRAPAPCGATSSCRSAAGSAIRACTTAAAWGGAETDHVSARLDAVAALRDIFGAARSAGAQVPDLEGARAGELRRAVKDATVDVWSGKEDRVLRRLRLRLSFEVQSPVAELAGGRLAFDAYLARVNEPVSVSAPADPRPAAELASMG